MDNHFSRSEEIHEHTPKRVLKLHQFRSTTGETEKTPPSYLNKLKNPFEAALREKLHTHFFSPTVFSQTRKDTPENAFKWNIEDIARITPADIDESSVAQCDSADFDSVLESITQSKIDKFFSMPEIAPSPMQQSARAVPLPVSHMHSPTLSTTKDVRDSCAQTVLTLPPMLPAALEEALEPYFNYTDDQFVDHSDDRELYQKLFEFGEKDVLIERVVMTPEQIQVDYSPVVSPVVESRQELRTIGTPGNMDVINNCDISPIILEGENAAQETPSHMSVDQSFTVPNVGIDKQQNCSLDFASFVSECSSPSDKLNESNWDIEYASMPSSPISSYKATKASDGPKLFRSRSFQAQRKKLSNSFNNYVSSDEECAESSQKTVKSDFGYQTGNSCDSCSAEGAWSKMVSSTPTKQKVY